MWKWFWLNILNILKLNFKERGKLIELYIFNEIVIYK